MQRPTDLNESQWQAVNHAGSHLLISAGPGTGKTHTLTRRIAQLIPSLKPNEKVLAITFTNKAAQQMKDRLTVLGVDSSHLFVGTFHGFCLKLLRDYFEHTALPKDFKIMMPDEIVGLLEVWTGAGDLVDQILDADNAVFSEAFLDQFVIRKRNSLLVDLSVTALVD